MTPAADMKSLLLAMSEDFSADRPRKNALPDPNMAGNFPGIYLF